MAKKTVNPVGTRRQQQKAETRLIILERARALFEERGFEKTTMRQVAIQSGVGLGTIFLHFSDKVSLFIAIYLYDLEKIQEKAMNTMPGNLKVCDKFLHLAKNFYSYYAKRPDLSKIMIKEMFFITGDRSATIKGPAMDFVMFVGEMLKDAKQKGELKADVDCGLAAMAFFSHYLNVLFFGLSEPEFKPDASVNILKHLLSQLMNGISADHG